MKGTNVNTESTSVFSLQMTQTRIIFVTVEFTELETVLRGAQLNIEDVQDIKFYKSETDLNTADVDISILAKRIVGVAATTNPKVVPPVIQEAVKDHLAAEYQQAAVQDPSQKRLTTVTTKQKRMLREVLTLNQEKLKLHITTL